jgi:hypothetical protein
MQHREETNPLLARVKAGGNGRSWRVLMTEEPDGPLVSAPVCRNGHPIDAGAVFCNRCGISLLKPVTRSSADPGGDDSTLSRPTGAPSARGRRPVLIVAAITLVLAIGIGIGVLAGSKSPSRQSVILHSADSSEHTTSTTQPASTTTTTATVPTTVPETVPTTTNPTATEQAAESQDQATVNNDEALVQQDAAQVQQLTTQYQSEQAAMTQQRAEEQGAVVQLEQSGQDNAQSLAALQAKYSASDQTQEAQLGATNTALDQANTKYQQDEASLSNAETALQVAQDVLSDQG